MPQLETPADVGVLLGCLVFMYWQPVRMRLRNIHETYSDITGGIQWSPPSWLFVPIWGTLFLITALSYYFYFTDCPGDRYYIEQFVLFFVPTMVGKYWIFVFFEMRHYQIAAYMAIFIFLCTVTSLILFFLQHQYLSGSLLLPQTCWLAYVTVLAHTIACSHREIENV
jgi:tryptophan-rich sensory protein